jgi:hypothetical protein
MPTYRSLSNHCPFLDNFRVADNPPGTPKFSSISLVKECVGMKLSFENPHSASSVGVEKVAQQNAFSFATMLPDCFVSARLSDGR